LFGFAHILWLQVVTNWLILGLAASIIWGEYVLMLDARSNNYFCRRILHTINGLGALALALTMAGFAPQAQAVPVFYNTQSVFNVATSGFAMSLDNLNDVSDSALATSLARPGYSLVDADPAAASLQFQNNSSSCSGGANPATGCASGTFGPNGFEFHLTSFVNALGLELINPLSPVLFITILDGADAGQSQAVAGNYSGSPNTSFFGVTSTALFSRVRIAAAAGINAGIDNVQFGTPLVINDVPLPAALPLFASGLGALALIARRRRKQANG
jgi:hypothetical protein